MRLALGLGLPYGSGVAFTPSFHPTQLPGLIALYDISDLSSLFVERTGASASTPASVDGVVGTVLDLSGNGRHLTAPSDAARAILRQSGNLFYLAFDGVDDRYTAAAPGDLSGASLGAVVQPSVGADGVIFGVQNTVSERFQFSTVAGVNVAGVQNADSGGFQRVEYAENSGEAITVSFQKWDGSSLTTYTNGVQANTTNVGGTIAVSGGSVYLGALPDDTFRFKGDFHVGGIYSRALDTTEQQSFELWLAARGEVSL